MRTDSNELDYEEEKWGAWTSGVNLVSLGGLHHNFYPLDIL